MAYSENYLQGLAQKSATIAGVPWQWIYAQWRHETGDFTNWGSTVANNFGGMKQFMENPPGIDATSPEGDNYQIFNSPEQYAEYFGNYLKKYYPDATNSPDINGYVNALKQGGYFTGDVGSYLSNVTNFLNGNIPLNPNAGMNTNSGSYSGIGSGVVNTAINLTSRFMFIIVGAILFALGFYLMTKDNTVIMVKGGKTA